MTAALSDAALHRLIVEDPARGWRAFVDQYTSTLLALIERAGIRDRDGVTEVYVRVCSRLAENECVRLQRYDPRRGPLAAWLTIVVRHAVVDWIRSERGRPRLFGVVKALEPFDQRVFELHYWKGRRPSEIVTVLGNEMNQTISIGAVFDALGRIHAALSDRHHSQLLAMIARTSVDESLDAATRDSARDRADTGLDPEQTLQAREIEALLADVLAALPAEDAAIVRLMFLHGWARHEVQRALRLTELSRARVERILSVLRSRLETQGVRSIERWR